MHAILEHTKEWDAKSVRDALAQAYKVMHATTGPVGHKRLRAAMPEYEYSASDMAEQKLMEVEAQRKGETTMRKRLLARIKPTALEISRSDLVLFGKGEHRPWLKYASAYPDHRGKLIAAVRAQARGWSARRLCREMGWPLASFQRHRDFAAEIIARQLNARGVERW